MELKIALFNKAGKQKILFLIIALIHLFLLANLKFTAWPEMTLWPYLITKGWLPYRDIAIAHTPLALVDLTIIYQLFGVGLTQLKLYTWSLVLLLDILLFYIAKKIWGAKTAVWALVFYLPIQLYFQGNGLWFDLALTPFALLVFYFLNEKSHLWAGVALALAFLTKQTAIWFLAPAILIMVDKNFVNSVLKFLVGIVITLSLFLFVLAGLGIVGDFFFWAIKFGIGILPQSQGQINLPSVVDLLKSLLPFSILALLPNIYDRRRAITLIGLSIFGFLGAFPRFELFHFQPALPFLAISAALVIKNISKLNKLLQYFLFLYLVLVAVLVFRNLGRQWMKVDRFFEPAILEVVGYIKNKTEPNEPIFVLNTWDNIYALSDTLPATKPWVPQFSWYLELPGIQEDMVNDLGKTRPKIIVLSPYSETGLASYRPKLISKFVSENYNQVDKIGGHIILESK